MMIASGNSSTSSAGTASTSFSWWSAKTICLVMFSSDASGSDVKMSGNRGAAQSSLFKEW